MPEPAHVVLGGLRALLGLLQLLLRLPELGQVQRRDLLRVLDLLLVPAEGIGSCFCNSGTLFWAEATNGVAVSPREGETHSAFCVFLYHLPLSGLLMRYQVFAITVDHGAIRSVWSYFTRGRH